MRRKRKSPRTRLRESLANSPPRREGKKSSCLISYIQDGVTDVKKLPEGGKVGFRFMAGFRGCKFDCIILFVGDKRQCVNRQQNLRDETEAYIKEFEKHNPSSINKHLLNCMKCGIKTDSTDPMVTFPVSEYPNVCPVVDDADQTEGAGSQPTAFATSEDETPVASEEKSAEVDAKADEMEADAPLMPENVSARVDENADKKVTEAPLVPENVSARVDENADKKVTEAPLVPENVSARVDENADKKVTEAPLVPEDVSAKVDENAAEKDSGEPLNPEVITAESHEVATDAVSSEGISFNAGGTDTFAQLECVGLDSMTMPVEAEVGTTATVRLDVESEELYFDFSRIKLQLTPGDNIIRNSSDETDKNITQGQISTSELDKPTNDIKQGSTNDKNVMEINDDVELKDALVLCRKMGDEGHLEIQEELPVAALSQVNEEYSAVYISDSLPQTIDDNPADLDSWTGITIPEVDRLFIYEHHDKQRIYRIILGTEAADLLHANTVNLNKIEPGHIYSIADWAVYGTMPSGDLNPKAVTDYLFHQRVVDHNVFRCLMPDANSNLNYQSGTSKEEEVDEVSSQTSEDVHHDPDYEAGDESSEQEGESESEESGESESEESGPDDPEEAHKKKHRRSKKKAKSPPEGWDSYFRACPREFRKHVFVKRLDPYRYRGPLVVLPKAACDFVGKGAAQHYCIFCKVEFSALTKHLQGMHKEEPRVKEIEKLKTAREKVVAYKLLAMEGDFKVNNSVALTKDKGILLTDKRSNTWREAKTLIHCSACFACIQKKNFDRHLDKCLANGPKRSLLEEKAHQIDLFPEEQITSQGQYLMKILSGLRDPVRRKICTTDRNIWNLLLTESLKKLRGQTSSTNVRSLANLICKYFEPLFERFGTTCTSDILIIDNADMLHDRLKEIGELDEFYQNHQGYIDKLRNSEKGRSVGQYTRSMNPALKALTAYAKHHAAKTEGFDSPKVGSHKALLEMMQFKKSWDNRIFFGLTLQRRMQAMHTDPEDKLLDEGDKLLLTEYLKNYLFELGTKHEADLDYSNKPALLSFYNKLVDAVTSLLIVFSVCRKSEVEGLTKTLWNSGIQSEPLTKGDNARAVATLTKDVATLGKGSLPVKVNVPRQYHSAIDKIIELQPHVGVPQTNPYVFAQAKTDKFRDGRHFFRKAAKDCGAKKPDCLTSQWQRRKFCTDADFMNMKAKDTAAVDRRLSHTRGVAQANYELHANKRLKETVVPMIIANFHGKGLRGKQLKDLKVAHLLEEAPDAFTGKKFTSSSGSSGSKPRQQAQPGSETDSENSDRAAASDGSSGRSDTTVPLYGSDDDQGLGGESDDEKGFGAKKKTTKRKAPAKATAKKKKMRISSPVRKTGKKRLLTETAKSESERAKKPKRGRRPGKSKRAEAHTDSDLDSDEQLNAQAAKEVMLRKNPGKNESNVKKKTSAKQSPVKKRNKAHKKSPAKKSPAKKSPAKKKNKARKESPAQESPAQESPAQESPAQESPAQERSQGAGKGGKRGPSGKWHRHP